MKANFLNLRFNSLVASPSEPIPNGTMVHFLCCSIRFFSFFSKLSFFFNSGVEWASWVNDDDFLGVHHDIWFVVFQPIGCLDRKVTKVFFFLSDN